jgi:hypothetical protein
MSNTPWARPANRSEAYLANMEGYTIIRVEDLTATYGWHVLYSDANGIESTVGTDLLTLKEAKDLAKELNVRLLSILSS